MDTTRENKTSQPGSTRTENDSQRHSQGGGGTVGAATEMARHYGEQARAAANHGTEAVRDAASRAGEQARSATAGGTEAARNIANRAREQVAPAAQAVYDQGARAGEYVTRNVHEYPATALLLAAAVGYGLAYLIHGGGRSLRWGRHEFHNRYDQGAH